MKITASILLSASLLLTPLVVSANNEMPADASSAAQTKHDLRQFVSFASAYTTAIGPVTSGTYIPLPNLAFPIQGTDIVSDANGAAFTLKTQGFYEITYGVSSLSGARLGVYIYPGSANPGFIPQSGMTLVASTVSKMSTMSFIYYNTSPSIPTTLALVAYRVSNFTLNAISGDVTAFMTIKKLD